ncbi:auxin-responsive protein iaa14 [Phtheirospermum japonicum]|uniref:Auxin-responsive protein n=1 Tax=Phtheirospermum japonicum TaxID=374723 RepID=A0A830CJT2_9LAMI|nr:auxin-responsive protein iaa14 [Phtheirospermum japonicum]
MVNTGLTYEEGKSNKKLDFEDTELRLGLPSGGDKMIGNANNLNYGKRGFEETISVDLKLNLAANEMGLNDRQIDLGQKDMHNDSMKPPAKTQVVGWPPIGSFRKNMMALPKGEDSKEAEKGSGATAFVKVSMDGAPYLRKVDLKMYKAYQELSDALGKMFGSFTMG